MQVLKESNYSLTQRLEQKSRMEEEYQEEIESLKKHLNSQREELKVLQELTDQSSLISDLRQRVSVSVIVLQVVIHIIVCGHT